MNAFHNRKILFAAICLVVASNSIQVFLQYLPSPIMQILAEEFGVSFVLMGAIMSVCTVASGFSPVLASLITDCGSAVLAWCLGILCNIVGALGAAAAARYEWMIVMYVLHGIGLGFSHCMIPVLVAKWIPRRYHATAMSVNLALHNLFVSVAYILPSRVLPVAGSWRNLMIGLAAAETLFALVLFLISCRYQSPPLDLEGERESASDSAANSEKRTALFGILWAAKNPTVRFLSLVMACFIWGNNTITTYFPTYLIQQGFDEVQAGAVTSIIPTMAILGALTIGVFGSRNKRIIMKILPLFIAVGGIGMFLTSTKEFVRLFAGLFGFAYQGWIPLAFSSFMALGSGDSRFTAGASALFNGLGHILTLLLPFATETLVSIFSVRKSLLLMQLPLLIAALLTIFILNKPVRRSDNGSSVVCT